MGARLKISWLIGARAKPVECLHDVLQYHLSILTVTKNTRWRFRVHFVGVLSHFLVPFVSLFSSLTTNANIASPGRKEM